MTYTHLTVGTSKIPAKPPRAQPPCTNPVVYGSNVLNDPGVELQAANVGTGPLGYEIPMYGYPGPGGWWPFVWSDNTTAPISTKFVAYYYTGTDTYRWKLSTANPDTGTYHLRIVSDDTLLNYGNDIYLADIKMCGSDEIASAMVEPGDYVKFSVRSMASPVTDGPRLWFQVMFYDAAEAYIAKFEPVDWQYLTGTYQTYSVDGFAPAGAVYCQVFMTMTATDTNFGAGPLTYDADNFVLKVSK